MNASCASLCRESWTTLLLEQGFAPVVAAGQAATPPRLLGRQVVVVGVSDGVVRGSPPTHLARRLHALRPQPAAGLISGFGTLALRDSLPEGAWGSKLGPLMQVERVFIHMMCGTARHAAR